MKHVSLFVILLTVFVLSACGPAPTPQPTVDVAATAGVISATMVAGTLTAQPTATPIPTDTPVPTATFTPIPTETPTLAGSAVTETATIPVPVAGEATATAFQGTLAPNGTKGPTGLFRIENETGETLLVTIYGVTKKEELYYFSQYVNAVYMFDIPWGSYNYTVMVGDKKTFSGTFGIANEDKTTMKVSMKRVNVVGP